MNQSIKVLDHGLVRLVSYMQAVPVTVQVEPEGCEGEWGDRLAQPLGWSADLEVVRNARTSYDAAWRAGEDEGKDAKLLDYLIKNRHTSPLEAMVFTFEIRAPIFTFRQWHRHRTQAYSEVSGRYSKLPATFYVPDLEDITGQSTSNKQMRTDEINVNAATIRRRIHDQCVRAFQEYDELLALGAPRELARGVLPLNTYSHMFCTVNMHNLFHFLKLRLDPHAQKEIRVYAEAMLKLIEPIVPVSVKAFKEHNA